MSRIYHKLELVNIHDHNHMACTAVGSAAAANGNCTGDSNAGDAKCGPGASASNFNDGAKVACNATGTVATSYNIAKACLNGDTANNESGGPACVIGGQATANACNVGNIPV